MNYGLFVDGNQLGHRWSDPLPDNWTTKAEQEAYWQRKDDEYEAYLDDLHRRQQDPHYIASYSAWLDQTPPLFKDET
jgi:hypothetical protein